MMEVFARIPKILRLVLLLGFVQSITWFSPALPTRIREPVAQECLSGDPPGRGDFQTPLEIPSGVLFADLSAGPPAQVVRVLKVPWRLPAPTLRIDRHHFSGLSPPLVPSSFTIAS